MAIYASLWFVLYLPWDVFLCCWEKRKMVPLYFPMSKQVFLGFSQYASAQHRAPWKGRNSIYTPGLVLFTPRLNNEITYSKIHSHTQIFFRNLYLCLYLYFYMYIYESNFYPSHF